MIWYLYEENPGVRKVHVTCNFETAMYSVCGETNYKIVYINVKNDVTWLFNWRHFIICFNKIRKIPLSLVEKPQGSPHEKYKGVPKGGGWYDKGQVHVFISGCKKSVS